jgi:hypothetical protein
MGAADARAVQLAAQRAPHGAPEPEPLVEVAHQHPRPRELVVQDVLPHQHPDLLGALPDLEPKMHVEHVQ